MLSSWALMAPVPTAAGKPSPTAQEYQQQNIGDGGGDDLTTSGGGSQTIKKDVDDDDDDDNEGKAESTAVGARPGTTTGPIL